MNYSPLNKDFIKNVRSAYLDKALSIFNYYNHYVFKRATHIEFKNMASKYGYCDIKNNRIVLSIRVVSLPTDLIEYIVVHEFCHFAYGNHQKEFYNEVGKYLKDYKNRIILLKQYSIIAN